MALKVIFIHGGPGLSAHPEVKLLGPLFEASGAQLIGWHEPTSARSPELSALGFWKKSLHAFLKRELTPDTCVIAHSFGATGLLSLLAEEQLRLDRLVLVSPSADLHHAQKRIVECSIRDFSKVGDEASLASAAELERLKAKSQACFDASMEEAMKLAFTNPQLISNYFLDPSNLAAYFGALAEAGSGFDLDRCFDILRDYGKNLTAEKTKRLPPAPSRLRVFWGKHDPITTESVQRAALARLGLTGEERVFESSAHFLHLEEKSEFVRAVLS